MVKKGNTNMKVTFDDRAFIIQVLSSKNHHLIFKEGTEKNEIVFSPSDELNAIAERIGVGFAPLELPDCIEFEAEFRMLILDKGDENYKTFTLKFEVKE